MGLQFAEALVGGPLTFGASITDLAFFDAGSGPVLHALGGDGINALTLSPGGALSVADSAAHGLFLTPGITPRFAEGAGPSLYLGAMDAGAARVTLAGAGYGATGAVTGLAAPLIAPVREAVGGSTYLWSGLSTGGIVTYREDAPGVLTETARLVIAADPALSDITAQTTAEIGGVTYVFAISGGGNAVTALAVGTDGALTVAGRIGADHGLGLSHPSEIAVAEVGGTHFVIVGSPGSSALSVLEVGSGGTLRYADHILDTLDTRFQGVAALDAHAVGGFTFVAAGGADDGVSLFLLLPNGRLQHLSSFADTGAATLTNTDAIALTDTGGDLQVIAAGAGEAGLTRLTHDVSALGAVVTGGAGDETLGGTALDDVIAGMAGSDSLSGGAGRDILSDGPGADTLSGGAGADLFVLDFDGEVDTITDLDPAEDRLDLSAWWFFYGAGSLTVTETATGATLSFRAETIEVTTAGGVPLTAAEVPGILAAGGPDRPIFFANGLTLTGTEGPDTLEGGAGFDNLSGEGGDDMLSGMDQSDLITGGAGNDTLLGGAGLDTLNGGDGADVLMGHDGPDALDGGLHGDTAHGGAGNDTVLGGGGRDALFGEAGADQISGGADGDRLFGAGGDDAVSGDGGDDAALGGEGHDAISGGDGADTLYGGAGDDGISGGAGADMVFAGAGADDVAGDGAVDLLFGEAGADTLAGGPGDDRLDGGADADRLAGGPGDDRLIGGTGSDVFVFADGFGRDRIADFDAADDLERIDLSAVAGIADWAGLQAGMVQVGADVRIVSGGDEITLAGVAPGDLDAADFLF